jgi:hypothetical protein
VHRDLGGGTDIGEAAHTMMVESDLELLARSDRPDDEPFRRSVEEIT